MILKKRVIKMNSPKTCESPVFRNVKYRKQSPIELKTSFRKNYQERIQKCRSLLLNSFRGISFNEEEIKNNLSELYKNTFNFKDPRTTDEEEQKIMNDVKEEFFQEELKWLIEEYEKSQMENIDWSSLEDDNNVICPICQKTNVIKDKNGIGCSHCTWTVKTQKTLAAFKSDIVSCVERHGASCNNTVEFSKITDTETHIYLVCSVCTDMQLVV